MNSRWHITLRSMAISLAMVSLSLDVWSFDPPCYDQAEHATSCEAIELCEDLCVSFGEPCDDAGKYVWFHMYIAPGNVDPIDVISGSCIAGYRLYQGTSCTEGSLTPVSSGAFPLDVEMLDGSYFLRVEFNTGSECCPGQADLTVPRELCVPPPTSDCATCFAPFTPTVGAEMLLTAWTRMPLADPTVTTYDLSGDTGPRILVQFAGSTTTYTARPSGPIIDGWQRMELAFVVPSDAAGVSYVMDAGTVGPGLFDDIRVSPIASSMKCYVYDPRNLRLSAELDERHFATMYEYDGEGRLTRIKKETERGIMTLQESRTFMPGVQP